MTDTQIWVYMLRCADGSYYIGKYQGDDLEVRIWEHNNAHYSDAYTSTRRPVECVWSEHFMRFDDAVACERKLKGWSRVKKEALIRGDEEALKAFSKRGFRPSSLKSEPSIS